MQPIKLQMLPYNASGSTQDMEYITNIINRSFASSEEGISTRRNHFCR
ncbi:hypothetical protein [Lentibacillus kapialis]|nr:hypothetical protein [Lentibacillus kapialis]